MNVFIDIETIPNQAPDALERCIDEVKAPGQYKKPESIQKWLDENKETEGHINWLKSSLTGNEGEVIAICFAVEDGPVAKLHRTLRESEAHLLGNFEAALCSSLDLHGHIQKPYFIGHNVRGFDLPFLFKRFVINNIEPGFHLKPYGRHYLDLYDTMEAWEGFNGRIKLDALAGILGLSGKTDGMDGSLVWPEVQAGNYQKVADYCADDVELVRSVYNRLTFNQSTTLENKEAA